MVDRTNDPWPQRPRFRALVDAWIQEHGIGTTKAEKNAQMAEELGIRPESLKQLYSGIDAPGRMRLNRIIAVFGCDPGELMDNPVAAPGVPPKEWTATDENTRAFANALWHEVKDLPPSKRKPFLDLVKSWKEL